MSKRTYTTDFAQIGVSNTKCMDKKITKRIGALCLETPE